MAGRGDIQGGACKGRGVGICWAFAGGWGVGAGVISLVPPVGDWWGSVGDMSELCVHLTGTSLLSPPSTGSTSHISWSREATRSPTTSANFSGLRFEVQMIGSRAS